MIKNEKQVEDFQLKDHGKELQQIIRKYFRDNEIKRHGNYRMIVKSIFMLSLFIMPLITLNLGIIETGWLVFLLYFICGVGMAGIGMSVMHDALHGSYSKNKTVNRIMGYSIYLIGANESVWKIQHNVLHHTYTNMDQLDDDLDSKGVLRFSPESKRSWFHKYQHIYAWFFYGLISMIWMSTRDFVRMKQYRKMGFYKENKYYRKEILKSIVLKLTFLTFILAIPIIVNPISWWVIFLAFLIMQFVTGIIISLVFQTAHIMPESEFPEAIKRTPSPSERLKHQLSTTCNYSPKSRFFSWFIGGLNFQIEHHLFPDICHIHYKTISKIVRSYVIKNELPYNSKTNFLVAIADHYKMLKMLGVSNKI